MGKLDDYREACDFFGQETGRVELSDGIRQIEAQSGPFSTPSALRAIATIRLRPWEAATAGRSLFLILGVETQRDGSSLH